MNELGAFLFTAGVILLPISTLAVAWASRRNNKSILKLCDAFDYLNVAVNTLVKQQRELEASVTAAAQMVARQEMAASPAPFFLTQQIVCNNCGASLVDCDRSGCGQRREPGWRYGSQD